MAQQRVQLISDEVTTRFTARGVTSESAQARLLDVAPSIHHRALKGARELNAFYSLRLLMTLGSPAVRDEINALFALDMPASTVEPEAVAS
jgi:hypothetical protein